MTLTLAEKPHTHTHDLLRAFNLGFAQWTKSTIFFFFFCSKRTKCFRVKIYRFMLPQRHTLCVVPWYIVTHCAREPLTSMPKWELNKITWLIRYQFKSIQMRMSRAVPQHRMDEWEKRTIEATCNYNYKRV